MKSSSSIGLTYAQNFEDVLLWRVFGDIKDGTYVDVGAFDPIEDSVSKVFYDAGWRGLNVDAASASAERFRLERPDEFFLNAVISDAPQPVTFFEFPGTGLSTCVPEIAERHIASGFEYKASMVPTAPLSALLDLAAKPEIHWLKIDVEGSEAAVLRSWYPSKVRPWVLVIEATAPNSQVPTHHEWAHLVERMGYSHVLFDGLSRFYVSDAHRDLAEALRASPNIFDGFSVRRSHFSASHLGEIWSEERQSLENQIQSAERRVADAVETISELSAQAKIWLEDRRSLEDHIQAAEKRAAHVAEINSQIFAQKEALSDELAHTKATLDHYSRHLASVQEKWSTEKQSLEAQITSAQAHALEAEAAVEQLGRVQTELALTEQRLESTLELVNGYVSQVADLVGDRQELHSRLAEALDVIRSLHAEKAEDQRRWQDLVDHLNNELKVERQAFAEARMLLVMVDTAEAFQGRWFSRARRDRYDRLQKRLQQWIASQGDSSTNSVSNESLSDSGTAERSQGNRMDIFTIDARNPYLRAESLTELCSHTDVDFVRRAYVTLLGRQPDTAGETYYCARVREGISKLTILDQMRRSPEGRAHDPGIAGLDAALRRHRRANWPILGWFLRALKGQEGNSPLERKLRSLENQQSVLANRADSRFLHTNHLLVELTKGIDQIGRELRQARIGTAGDPSQLQRSLSQAQGDWKSKIQATLES